MKLPDSTDTKIYVDESDYLHGTDLPDDVIAPFEPRQVSLKRDEEASNKYEILEEIGEGKFGTVYKCREKDKNLFLAAKFITTKNDRSRKEVEHEIDIMQRLQHPRIIQLYDAFASSNTKMVLIMELVEGGELFERVADDIFVLTELSAMQIMRQICDAMAFIHEQNIVHLDMKPENILCLTKQSNRIKLIDFGLAQEYREGDDLKVIAGTAEFIAPEVINFEKVDYKSDMWSIGVICYILLSGYSPFLGDTVPETYANVTKGDWDFEEEVFQDVSESGQNFISQLLIKQREKRMDSKDCLRHPWLSRDHHNSAEKRLHKDRLKRYVIKRRWKKAVTAITAVIRLGWRFSDLFSAYKRGETTDMDSSPAIKLKRMGVSRELTDYIVSQMEGNYTEPESLTTVEETASRSDSLNEATTSKQTKLSNEAEAKMIAISKEETIEPRQSKLSLKAEELKIAIEKMECRRTESGTDSGIEGDHKSRSVSADDFKFTPIASPTPTNENVTPPISQTVAEDDIVHEKYAKPILATSEEVSIEELRSSVHVMAEEEIVHLVDFVVNTIVAEDVEKQILQVTVEVSFKKPAKKINRVLDLSGKDNRESAQIKIRVPRGTKEKTIIKKIPSKKHDKPPQIIDPTILLNKKVQLRKLKLKNDDKDGVSQADKSLDDRNNHQNFANQIANGVRLKKTSSTEEARDDFKVVGGVGTCQDDTHQLNTIKSKDLKVKSKPPETYEDTVASGNKLAAKPPTMRVVKKKNRPILPPTREYRIPSPTDPPLKWSPFPTPITTLQKSTSSIHVPRVKTEVSGNLRDLLGKLTKPVYPAPGLQRSASHMKVTPTVSQLSDRYNQFSCGMNKVDASFSYRPMNFWKAMEVTHKPMAQSMHVDFSGKEVKNDELRAKPIIIPTQKKTVTKSDQKEQKLQKKSPKKRAAGLLLKGKRAEENLRIEESSCTTECIEETDTVCKTDTLDTVMSEEGDGTEPTHER